jgi:hypothetical protein
MEQFAAAGDEASRVFADADWSDEINHVRYGKRWLEYFLRDDARSLEDIDATDISGYRGDWAGSPIDLPESRIWAASGTSPR